MFATIYMVFGRCQKLVPFHTMSRSLVIDVHSHIYLPRYASLLRTRTSVPRIVSSKTADDQIQERLLILDQETATGRPVGPQYWDQKEKIQFMDKHDIDVSIVSLANPWLDFLDVESSCSLARELNDDMESYCSSSPILCQTRFRRIYGFGLLPLVPDVSISSLLDSVKQVSASPHLKGIVIGSRGIGRGLDDASLDPVWEALQATGLVIFVHPHYGLDAKEWGEIDNGHVLPLGLGFPLETTIAVTRMILSGVLDRFPSLRLLLAHAGGALPLLSSRLAMCIEHDPIVASRLNHDARYYLGKLYYDAMAYGAEELGLVNKVVARAEQYAQGTALASAVDQKASSRHFLFGTDHPFFPPLEETDKWKTVLGNLDAIDRVEGWDSEDKDGVKGGNALTLFDL